MIFIDEKWYGGTIRRGRRRMENKDLLTKEEIIKVWNDVGDGATWGEYTQAIARAQLSKVLDAGYEKLPKYDDDIVENLKGLIYTEIIDWATKEGMTDKVLDSIVRREIIPLCQRWLRLIPVTLSEVESLSHFGVIRDWIIRLKNGQQIEIDADVIAEIVTHENKKLGYLSPEEVEAKIKGGIQ